MIVNNEMIIIQMAQTDAAGLERLKMDLFVLEVHLQLLILAQDELEEPHQMRLKIHELQYVEMA